MASRVKCVIVDGLEILCSALDKIPRYERQYGWSRHGCWGCYPLRLANKSVELDDRWQTGRWSAPPPVDS